MARATNPQNSIRADSLARSFIFRQGSPSCCQQCRRCRSWPKIFISTKSHDSLIFHSDKWSETYRTSQPAHKCLAFRDRIGSLTRARIVRNSQTSLYHASVRVSRPSSPPTPVNPQVKPASLCWYRCLFGLYAQKCCQPCSFTGKTVQLSSNCSHTRLPT